MTGQATWARAGRAGTAAVLAGAALLLAGCGGAGLPWPGGGTATGPGADRATLEAQGRPVLRAALPARGTTALMRPSGRNGDVVTWRSSDAVSVALDAGVLVATRGLGFDLMSAETTRARAALAEAAAGAPSSGAGYPRIYGYLDGEHRPQFRSFFCRLAGRDRDAIETLGTPRAVIRITEACSDPDLEITNIYWRAPDGLTWKSRQWIGPELGYLHTERLVR